MRRRMFLQVLAVICQPSQFIALDVMQGVGQSHFTMPVMMTIRFAVSSDMNQLIPLAPIIEGAHQPVSETLAAG